MYLLFGLETLPDLVIIACFVKPLHELFAVTNPGVLNGADGDSKDIVKIVLCMVELNQYLQGHH